MKPVAAAKRKDTPLAKLLVAIARMRQENEPPMPGGHYEVHLREADKEKLWADEGFLRLLQPSFGGLVRALGDALGARYYLMPAIKRSCVVGWRGSKVYLDKAEYAPAVVPDEVKFRKPEDP